MTTTTIAFPGGFEAYADHAPEPQTDSIRVIGKGTRRHPNRPGRWATAVATLILSFVFGAALTQLAASPADAAVTSHGSLWYDGATCRAFASWERHQTWPRFGRMVRDARHADTYLRVDVGTLDRAEREHAPRNVRAELATFVWLDCNTSGD